VGRLLAALVAACLVTSVVSVAAVARFAATAKVVDSVLVASSGAEFLEASSDLVVSVAIRNSSCHRVRVEYLWLTVTADTMFIGTAVSGHGPRAVAPEGPEFVAPGQTARLTMRLHLEEIYRTYYRLVQQSQADLKARGVVTLSIPDLGTQFDHRVEVVF